MRERLRNVSPERKRETEKMKKRCGGRDMAVY
jgi:hypothetical protein